MKVYKPLSITLIICMSILFTVGCYSSKIIESKPIEKTIHSLGTAKNDIKSKETSNSTIGFKLKKGDKVKFSYDSNVKEGTLKIQLMGSEHKEIQDFPINKSSTKEFVVDKDEDCSIRVSYENFIGKYEIYGDKIN